MAITSRGKIGNMMNLGKTDTSVAIQYDALETEHDTALVNKENKKQTLEYSKHVFSRKLQKEQIISTISHPVKKALAIREVWQARKKVQDDRKAYKAAKQQLKNAQIKLRAIRKTIREQYKAVKQNENMKRKVAEMQRSNRVTIPMKDMINFNNQAQAYAGQTYHIDINNPHNNTIIFAPNKELYSNINKLYIEHKKIETKEKVEGAVSKVKDKVQEIGRKVRGDDDDELVLGGWYYGKYFSWKTNRTVKKNRL